MIRHVTDMENDYPRPDTVAAKTVGRVLILLGTAAMTAALIFPDDENIIPWCIYCIAIAACGLLLIGVAHWIEYRR